MNKVKIKEALREHVTSKKSEFWIESEESVKEIMWQYYEGKLAVYAGIFPYNLHIKEYREILNENMNHVLAAIKAIFFSIEDNKLAAVLEFCCGDGSLTMTDAIVFMDLLKKRYSDMRMQESLQEAITSYKEELAESFFKQNIDATNACFEV